MLSRFWNISLTLIYAATVTACGGGSLNPKRRTSQHTLP